MLDNDVWGAAAQVRMANRWHSAAANWNSALTQALLDSANLRQSDLVVDVAAGSGDPRLEEARRRRTRTNAYNMLGSSGVVRHSFEISSSGEGMKRGKNN
jgi:hypothetical protein